jgi:hypothetical protein
MVPGPDSERGTPIGFPRYHLINLDGNKYVSVPSNERVRLFNCIAHGCRLINARQAAPVATCDSADGAAELRIVPTAQSHSGLITECLVALEDGRYLYLIPEPKAKAGSAGTVGCLVDSVLITSRSQSAATSWQLRGPCRAFCRSKQQR